MQAKEKVKVMPNDGSGQKCTGFAKYSSLDGCWLKTLSDSSVQKVFDWESGESCLETFCETWPKSGMVTSNGIAFELPSAEAPTSDPESGYWPTPQAADNRDRGNLSMPAIKRRLSLGKQLMLSMVVSDKNGRLNPMWVEWLMGFPLGFTDCED